MKEIINAINRANTIALLPHINVDGDALGSAVSLCSLLKEGGHDAFVVLEESPPPYLSFLCNDYKFESGKCDLAIAVDCADEGRLGKRLSIFKEAKETICIDHHETNVGYAKFNYIDADASSTGEIICRLFEELKKPFSRFQAEALYTAIMTDTGGFRFANSTPKSFRQAAKLVEAGARPAEIATLVYENMSIARIRLTVLALTSLKLYCENRIATIFVSQDDLKITGATIDDCEGFSALGRSIEGVEVAVLITQTDKFKVSLRSKGYVDVAKIAQIFGGGGHKKASGFTVDEKDINSLEANLIEHIITALEAGE